MTEEYKKIISDLKNKIYRPIYFLAGDEPFYIDKISDYIENNVLTESEKSFNQTILYGKDTSIENVINAAKRYPMMANHQVVIVKEAQELKNIELLIHYVNQPLPSTILVLNYKYKKLDKRKELGKKLGAKNIYFETKPLYDNQVPKWISDYLAEKGKSIEPAASILLTENLGTDLSKISNELDKLIITLPQGETKITASQIEKNIGLSKDYSVFELQNAIGTRDILKANRIVNYFAKNAKNYSIIPTITILFSFFCKLILFHKLPERKSQQEIASAIGVSPYFVSFYTKAASIYSLNKIVNVISYLREYDVKSKGVDNVSNNDGELLKELIYKIMH